MSPQNLAWLEAALALSQAAFQVINKADLDAFERNDHLDPSDACRHLDEAVHSLRCALGLRQGDEARDE